MSSNDATVWVVRAGETGQADSLFLQTGYVAVGWCQMGDLSKIAANREAFKAALLTAYPDTKSGALNIQGGLLYRFLYEVKSGDYVLYPSKIDHQIHIGIIEGSYEYNPSYESRYPNLRKVKWLAAFPRTRFSQGALAESNSIMTLFQVRNYADEFLSVLNRKIIPPAIPVEDFTTVLVAEQIEQTTRDFIMKSLTRELKGHPFADFMAHLLQTMGYRTRVSPQGPDEGIDIVAHKDELELEPPVIKVQVKSTEGSIGNEVVSSLVGRLGPNDVGLFVTLGTFTNPARNYAKDKSNLRLMDGDEVFSAVLNHYEQLDSKYKSIIPLKQVYVPQPEIPEES